MPSLSFTKRSRSCPLFEAKLCASNFIQILQASFNITDDNDGSALSYNVTYTNALTGDVCAEHRVLPSSCQNGACVHLFDVSTSSCPRSVPISVDVKGTNVLGTGPRSTPVSIFGMYISV